MRICVYPGSFDPFSEGHLDVLRNAVSLFDCVYVGVLNNSAKHATFTPKERVDMIKRVVSEAEFVNVKVESFDGLLVDYVKKVGASYIIRGLRAIMDFEYEFQIDAVIRHLDPDIQNVFFMASPAHSFLSSSTIKEIGSLGGNIQGLVPECNIKMIRERLMSR